MLTENSKALSVPIEQLNAPTTMIPHAFSSVLSWNTRPLITSVFGLLKYNNYQCTFIYITVVCTVLLAPYVAVFFKFPMREVDMIRKLMLVKIS